MHTSRFRKYLQQRTTHSQKRIKLLFNKLITRSAMYGDARDPNLPNIHDIPRTKLRIDVGKSSALNIYISANAADIQSFPSIDSVIIIHRCAEILKEYIVYIVLICSPINYSIFIPKIINKIDISYNKYNMYLSAVCKMDKLFKYRDNGI